jgi:hypothetical protein
MVKPRAAVNFDQPIFKGEHAALLEEFSAILRRLWDEHYTSPIFAGEEMIFTLGGNGYEIVFSHQGYGALIEIRSPHGGIDLRPDTAAGGVTIAKVDAPEGMPADEMLRDFFAGIDTYYRRGPRLRV